MMAATKGPRTPHAVAAERDLFDASTRLRAQADEARRTGWLYWAAEYEAFAEIAERAALAEHFDPDPEFVE